jgi:hypothetical protein
LTVAASTTSVTAKSAYANCPIAEWPISSLFRDSLAEDALRVHDEEDDERQESEGVL